ncbi:MAG: hypothetical protein U9N36_07215 [Euryarchaeota archaeon]|nr:hypothetical protein [Euryarchaeota archaeon]
MFTAYCPELDVASCGHAPEEARKNLGEVIAIQLEETARLGTLKDFLVEAGYTAEDEVLETEKYCGIRRAFNLCWSFVMKIKPTNWKT